MTKHRIADGWSSLWDHVWHEANKMKLSRYFISSSTAGFVLIQRDKKKRFKQNENRKKKNEIGWVIGLASSFCNWKISIWNRFYFPNWIFIFYRETKKEPQPKTKTFKQIGNWWRFVIKCRYIGFYCNGKVSDWTWQLVFFFSIHLLIE